MPDVIAVFCMCASEIEAQKLAHGLIEANLAACVNMLPGVQSVYRWQGTVETAQEVLLLIKSTAPRFAELRDLLLSLHTYQNPEIVAVPICDGAAPYLNWVEAAVRRPSAT